MNLYLHHPQVCSCSNPCREQLPNVFIRLDGDRCVRSWYLTQTPELTAYFCQHPDAFVLNDVACPGDRSAER